MISLRRPALIPLAFAVVFLGRLSGEPAPVIDLWPEGVPGFKADAPKERNDGQGHIYSVDHPTLTVLPADPAKSVGTALIVCPGGGYVRLAVATEGSSMTQWLNSLGISVFILKYRLSEYGHPAPLQDVLRAVRLVRSRAAEFHVRPDRIGVFGGSAGGHLAACAGTLYDDPAGKTGAALDSVSGRPTFLVLLYPVITMRKPFVHAGSLRSLLGKTPDPALVDLLSVEDHVTKDTPPTFIAHSQEDKSVSVENSIKFYEALTKAGVPSELHLYSKGPHGFGMTKGLGPTSDWPARVEDWLRFKGWLTPAA